MPTDPTVVCCSALMHHIVTRDSKRLKLTTADGYRMSSPSRR